MKALILLATLKKDNKSNTATLVDFLCLYLKKAKIDFEIVRLSQQKIVPGTYTVMDEKDDWPAIYQKIIDSKIILFATPLWWNNHSSELQRIIERLDEVYDMILAGQDSPLDGKIGGVIITGDSDGVEHVTANIANFFCSVGIVTPPYTSLGVIWDGHAKDANKTKSQQTAYYKRNYAKDAQAMAQSLAKYARK